jgi:CRISPR-associated protein Cas2
MHPQPPPWWATCWCTGVDRAGLAGGAAAARTGLPTPLPAPAGIGDLSVIFGEPQLWVIAYDSPSNKRRRKLAKLLEGYGERLQMSVFECRLQPHQLRQLRQLLACIATAEDSVRIWPIPPRAPAAEQLGRPVEHTPWQDKVI